MRKALSLIYNCCAKVMQGVSVVELVVGVCAGVSLSAACGFRVFLPLLAVSIAVHFFGFKVNADFEWIGSWISIVSLATATIVEVAVYYLPCVDNILDIVNVPLAFVAGAVVMSGALPDVHPYLKWSIAGLLGGSVAGVTQLATTLIHGASTATTAGAGNNVVSSSENVCATIFSVGAILIPLLAIAIVMIFLCILGSRAKRFAARVAKIAA